MMKLRSNFENLIIDVNSAIVDTRLRFFTVFLLFIFFFLSSRKKMGKASSGQLQMIDRKLLLSVHWVRKLLKGLIDSAKQCHPGSVSAFLSTVC